MQYNLKKNSLPTIAMLLCTMLFVVFVTAPNAPALAKKNKAPSIIRDAEIEDMIKGWAEPVIRAAELDPDAVKIVLVKANQTNAFVAGGQNIFIYTGLLQDSKSAAEILGVLAHEIGHIRGGHLVRSHQQIEYASYEALLGVVFGLGAALLSGEGKLGAAIAAGSQASAMNRFMAFSRTQESSADQAALSYLEKAKINPAGLLSFMKNLENQELLPPEQQIEYARTHPLTRDRIATLTYGLSVSAYKDKDWPKQWAQDHARLKAKLVGFIYPERVDWEYDRKDHSVAARYARAIAAYRTNEIEKALSLIDDLIKTEPENPFFHELKGQMLVDFSRVEAALPHYKKAVKLKPKSGLFRIAYAHALIETSHGVGANTKLEEAIEHLNWGLRIENRSARVYRLLATAYGRLGNDPVAKLYLAEEALLKRDFQYAKRQANVALKGFDEGTATWIRAQDILFAIETMEKNKPQKSKKKR